VACAPDWLRHCASKPGRPPLPGTAIRWWTSPTRCGRPHGS